MSDPIVVWGAGAIGGTIGAHLKKAGHEVIFVDAADAHVDKVRTDGLHVGGPVADFRVHAPIHRPNEMKGTFKRIILCVKAHQTADAVRQLYRHLHEDGYVLSAQNGLNENLIAQLVGQQRTVGACLNFSASFEGPGEVVLAGRGLLTVGELDGSVTPRIEDLAEVLRAFEPDTKVTENIWGYLWGKLGWLSMLYATALTTDPVAGCLIRPEFQRLFLALGIEVMTTARLERADVVGFNGFDPAAFTPDVEMPDLVKSVARMAYHYAMSGRTHSEIYADLHGGRRTEVDAHIGAINDAASGHGLETPLVRRMIGMIHEIEEGRRPQALANLDELDRIIDPTGLRRAGVPLPE